MSQYDYITKNIRFSFSSASTFNTCKYSFKLTYIDVEERLSNFFAEFGTLCHDVMENFWNDTLSKLELEDYYKNNYNVFIKSSPPITQWGGDMGQKYHSDGIDFFSNFSIDKSEYEVISIEEEIKTKYNDIEITIRPDLLVKNKKTNQIELWDYKTSKPEKYGVWDESKINSYKKQLVLYKYFVEKAKNISIDKMVLLFIRLGKTYEFTINKTEEKEVLDWFENTINQINIEENFDPTVDEFFCSNLCSVRNSCKYWR